MMEGGLSLLFAGLIGFGHAFEADHLLAVSTLVSKSKSTRELAGNGFIWGLGHTSTIFLIGLLLIVFNVQGLKNYFEYFELLVAFMLIALGIIRFFKDRSQQEVAFGGNRRREAYGIGLIHGLAGSGALVLLVLTDLDGKLNALSYLLLFGLGSALGMSFAASVLRIPILLGKADKSVKRIFSFLSSSLCILYGFIIISRFI